MQWFIIPSLYQFCNESHKFVFLGGSAVRARASWALAQFDGRCRLWWQTDVAWTYLKNSWGLWGLVLAENRNALTYVDIACISYQKWATWLRQTAEVSGNGACLCSWLWLLLIAVIFLFIAIKLKLHAPPVVDGRHRGMPGDSRNDASSKCKSRVPAAHISILSIVVFIYPSINLKLFIYLSIGRSIDLFISIYFYLFYSNLIKAI